MKLYFSPGACSLSPHIALREAGLDFELERVDFATKKTKHSDDFTAINPNGYVPALRLDDGELLTEGPAIVQWIADQVPARKLAPPNGSFARVRLQEALNFISTELHKSFSPLFSKECPEAWKVVVRQKLAQRFDVVDRRLGLHPFFTGDDFSVADGYLFTVTNWPALVGFDLSPWSNLLEFRRRVGERPAVLAALEAEGLRKPAT